MMRVSFPEQVTSEADLGYMQDRRVSVVLNKGSDVSTVTTDADGVTWITGYTTANHGSVPANFKSYFAIGIYGGADGNKPTGLPIKTHADNTWAYVDLSATNPINSLITLRVGTSLISPEQAMTSLQNEVGTDKSFESIVAASKAQWNAQLSKIEVAELGPGYTPSEGEGQKTTFYSALYRASIFPRQLTEIDATGQEVHWSPYDGEGQVYPGPLSTDSGVCVCVCVCVCIYIYILYNIH